jgi:alkaline phosphatase
MTRLKRGETVVFSYIVFRSRAHRDRVNAKVIKEISSTADQSMEMPFDMKRMAYGGFQVIVGG